MVPIAPGETISFAARWEIDTNTAPSGTYSGSFLIQNDNDPSDPDDTVTLISFELHDPPILTDNTSEIINPAGANQITISNAANEPHAGATRASGRVTSIRSSNSRFSVSGLAVGGRIDAGQTEAGVVAFDAAGAAAGTYTAQLSVGLEMTSPFRGFLNGKQPVPDRVWTVQYTVAASGQDVANVTTGQNLGAAGLDINSSSTGFTLLDGVSGSNQTLTAQFDNSPPSAGGVLFVNQAIDLGCSVGAGLYVLQISYQDSDVPPGFLEQELRLYSYDNVGSQWVAATQLNSNGGTAPAGASPFIGSYAAYLAGPGGGTLDSADLSAFGIDPGGNRAWAVLDHASLFRLGTTLTGTLPPQILSIARDPATNLNTITYQSFANEVFKVRASSDLSSWSVLPDTPVGDGSIKQLTHTPNPTTGSQRQFYRLIRN